MIQKQTKPVCIAASFKNTEQTTEANTKATQFNVRVNDEDDFRPTGIVVHVADDGRRVLADLRGEKKSVFSNDMKYLGHSEYLEVWDIALLNEPAHEIMVLIA